MTREDIIRMAREAWLSDKEAQFITEFDEAYISCTYLEDLEKFAALVASAEREWVGLDDDEMLMIYGQPHEGKKYSLGRMIEAKLKEKNT